MDRLEMLLDLIDKYPPQDPGCCPDPATASECLQYLLVESSRIDGGYWLTPFSTTDQAADYHDSQEYAGDWSVEGLYDLDTGNRFDPVTSFATPADESQLTVSLAGGATYETYGTLFSILLGRDVGWNIDLNGIEGQVLEVNDDGIRIRPPLDELWLTYGEPMDLVPWNEISSIVIY